MSKAPVQANITVDAGEQLNRLLRARRCYTDASATLGQRYALARDIDTDEAWRATQAALTAYTQAEAAYFDPAPTSIPAAPAASSAGYPVGRCHGESCAYPEPHRHGFSCDRMCECDGIGAETEPLQDDDIDECDWGWCVRPSVARRRWIGAELWLPVCSWHAGWDDQRMTGCLDADLDLDAIELSRLPGRLVPPAGPLDIIAAEMVAEWGETR
ncbi:MAG: hypothetical protein ACRDQA_23750 [Nocardioidaceae bacterium]